MLRVFITTPCDGCFDTKLYHAEGQRANCATAIRFFTPYSSSVPASPQAWRNSFETPSSDTIIATSSIPQTGKVEFSPNLARVDEGHRLLRTRHQGALEGGLVIRSAGEPKAHTVTRDAKVQLVKAYLSYELQSQ